MFLRIAIAAISFLIILTTNQAVRAQYLSSSTDDKTYFDNLQYDIEGEVEEARENLVDQAKVVEVATRNFAASKLKQNFFKALRYLAERELESISMQDRLRQPRQEDGEDDSNNSGSDSSASTQRTVPLIPVVANILKAAFGGENAPLNFTRHLQAASKLILRPIGSQITGLTNLLGFTKPVPEVPVAIAPASVRTPGTGKSQPSYNVTYVTTPDVVVARLLKKNVNSTSPIVPVMMNLGNVTSESSNGTIGSSNVTTEVPVKTIGASGNVTSLPDLPAGPGVIYIDILAKDIQDSLDGLLKAMPDLFKGAKEAISLLQSIRDIYDD